MTFQTKLNPNSAVRTHETRSIQHHESQLQPQEHNNIKISFTTESIWLNDNCNVLYTEAIADLYHDHCY
jgi:hypothetical protein